MNTQEIVKLILLDFETQTELAGILKPAFTMGAEIVLVKLITLMEDQQISSAQLLEILEQLGEALNEV